MKRRYLVGASALVFTAVLATTFLRCDFPALEYKPTFSYIPRERPRVFVSHHPLRTTPGQPITIRLTPELRPGDVIQRVVARIGAANSAERQELSCAEGGGGTFFTCAHTLPDGDTHYIYDGRVVLQDGTDVKSLGAYRFKAANTIGVDEVLTLREPVKPLEELDADYRIDTVLVHDAGDGYAPAAFLADVESAVYAGVLADPVYRWRDNQLAFYQYGSPGFTSSYYSGFDTRCGQNPWPELGDLPTALNGMDVMGVLHRHPDTAGGVEGTVTATTVFRDCAGAVENEDLKTFSATGGEPLVAKHEYGHAAFDLGDEYTEADSTRRVPPADDRDDGDLSCCCVVPTAGGGTTTQPGGSTTPGVGVVVSPAFGDKIKCAKEGGGFEPERDPPLLRSFPACADLPPTCWAKTQGGCSPLTGECVRPTMWLGAQPPSGSNPFRQNTFATEDACKEGRAAALIHPGVEDREQSVEAVCRPLCGGSLPACPCGQDEAWIVDKQPNATPVTSGTGTDSMGTVVSARHGGTCAWCVETSLCVRWHRARGVSADDAWDYCKAPPLDAAAQERGFIATVEAFARAFAEFFRELLRDVIP